MPHRFWKELGVYAVALLTIAGCASTHNLKADGTNLLGGGFFEEELRPGLYRISAKSNMALWPDSEAARKTWEMRADHLCGRAAHESFGISQSDGKGKIVPIVVPARGIVVQRGSARTYNATMSGYILCKSANMTISEAEDLLLAQQKIDRQEADDALKVKLEQLGGDNCTQAESGASAETFFRRGKVLLSLERYSDAKACFIFAQQVEKDSYFYREACMSLGLMYEIGIGVEKNPQEAKVWYRKAGL